MKKVSAGLLTVLLSVVLFAGTGCFGFTGCGGLLDLRVRGISFSRGDWQICVGERTELNRYVSFTPNKARNKQFSVESDDQTVVAIETRASGGTERYYAVGVGPGTATLTATAADGGYTAEVTVTVTYASPDTIAIATQDVTVIDGVVVLHASNLTPVVLRAELPENIDPNTQVVWKAGALSRTLSMNEPFTYTPSRVGQTVVTATVSGENGKTLSDTLKINVYDDPEYASASYFGSLTQKAGNYSAVHLSVDYAFADGNPDPVMQWFVNGEAASVGDTFSFTPSSPGVYVLEGKLNGQAVPFADGDASVRLLVSGTITPQNVYLDFDNCYPKVFIRWDAIVAAAGYKVSITDTKTEREITGGDLSTENTAARAKFTDSGVDATAYFSQSVNIFNTSFSVRVKTLGDATGTLTESPWSAAYVSQTVDAQAKEYLADTFYDGARNHYVRSYAEFYEWFEYAMLWRPSTLSDGETLYLDYAFADAQDEIQRAMQQMHFTGLYSYTGMSNARNKRECTFVVEFRSDGTPSKKTTRHAGEAWNALRPHVNYDASKARSAKYVFPIDVKMPVTVETSDQLYYVTQLGYRPVPASGSVAEKLYNYARRTLRYIVTDDMSDAEKLHAIYDWIMWRVTYDSEVLSYTQIADSVQYESFYLESVLTDSGAYGVCDAMSKAYVLLCGIEGFECVRVTGMAGTGKNVGGHAWNKVKLDGRWYVVDCTWGDASMQLTDGGAYKESASHLYFLVTDTDIASTHTEDENGAFPATAKERYPWYAAPIEYDGDSIDLYLEGTLTTNGLRNATDDIVRYAIDGRDAASAVFSVGPDTYVNRSNTDYYACEFVADEKWGDGSRLSVLRTTIEGRLTANGVRKYYLQFQKIGTKTHVLLFLPL